MPRSLTLDQWEAIKPLNGLFAGVDEAGRGSWAGPVVVAAVVLPEYPPPELLPLLHDSKEMNRHTRQQAAAMIVSLLPHGLGTADHDVIDRHGIAAATAHAALRAVRQLLFVYPAADMLLLDGNAGNWKRAERGLSRLVGSWHYMEKADAKVKAVSAASILAKDLHDYIMIQYAKIFPLWAFDRNVGYGTDLHRRLLAFSGPSPIHRRSFRPLRRFVSWEEWSGYSSHDQATRYSGCCGGGRPEERLAEVCCQ